jgi:hypothetical protein
MTSTHTGRSLPSANTCPLLFNHHNKSESARVHLHNCASLRKYMNGKEVNEQPTWYQSNKKPQQSISTSSKAPRSSGSQLSIKTFALPAVSKQVKNCFHNHMAMHY